MKVLPVANPDQLSAFQRRQVDAVWTVEPWVTRLEREAGGKVFLEDNNVQTTWLVSSAKFLKNQGALAKKIAAANVELTQWIQAHPEEAQKLLAAELKEETKATIAPEAIAQAWGRIKFTSEVSPQLVTKAVQDAKDAGLVRGTTDTSKLLSLP